MKSREEDRPFSCDICKATFKYKISLKSHLESHSDERPWKCEICGTWKVFSTKASILKYKNFILLSKLGVSLKKKNSLVSHANLHTGEKPYECEICHVKFASYNTLKAHMIVHEKPNRFKCPYDNCGKVFNFKQHLKSHLKIHTGKYETAVNSINSNFNCSKESSCINYCKLYRLFVSKSNSNDLIKTV